MTHEMLVGIHVVNENLYGEYRQAIAPLLKSLGGGFRYDFKVAETLKCECSHPINRVFTIYFADNASKERFYSDPDYKKIKAELFDRSVGAATIISEYTHS